jgi:hypothetical protein
VETFTVEELDETAGRLVVFYHGGLDGLPDRFRAAGLDLFQAGGGWLLQAY